MDSFGPLGRLAPPLSPEGSADATDSVPAHPAFFRLAWRSMDLAERAAAARELARAEEGFLVAFHGFRRSAQAWLEGLAMLALAAVYRLRGFDLPDWLAENPQSLAVTNGEVELFSNLLLLIEITPPDSPFLWELLADVRKHRKGGEWPL